MSENVPPLVPIEDTGQVPAPHSGRQAPWLDADLDEDAAAAGLKRMFAAMRRFRWLLVLSAIAGAGLGAVMYQRGVPTYTVNGSFFINQEVRGGIQGPIRQGEFLQAAAWEQLLRTSQVLNHVVISERLYLSVAPEDAAATEAFQVGNRYAWGNYRLLVDSSGRRWTLFDTDDLEVDAGMVGDSIGLGLGFLWQLAQAEMVPSREIAFQVKTPADAARELEKRIDVNMDRTGSFIFLGLSGPNPAKITSILSSLMDRLEELARDLKRRELDESIVFLKQQLDTAQAELTGAESQLGSFQVRTITLPTEQSGPIAPGLAQTEGPVVNSYFTRRLELDDLRRDRQRLEDVIDALPQSGVRIEAFETIPILSQQATQLRAALSLLAQEWADLDILLQQYTDAYRPVQEAQARIRQLETVQVPSLARAFLAELIGQEDRLESLIAARASELAQMPPRAMEEARLQRKYQSANGLFLNIQSRYETARLAAASSLPDIGQLDQPSEPQVPSLDERVRIALIALIACIGVGMGLAVLMDRFDPRLRYPTEISGIMGLDVLGAVPRVKQRKKHNAGIILEAFREIRMRVQYAYGNARPLVMAITSPESGEGKTFVTANLAITFAQLGRKTLVIDADTRRGDLHELFEIERKPGLTELFRHEVDGSVIQRTQHDNLHALACGSRYSESPDLLSSGEMQEILAAAKRRYDVILIDCPPMAAGSDAFILGTHAGSVMIVLRSGATHKELARAKMEAFYRLPVRLLGAILNDVEAGSSYGAYDYYSYYLPGYQAGQEEAEDDAHAVAI